MARVTQTVYGIGGYDPTKPDDNIVAYEKIEVPDEPADAADPTVESLARRVDELVTEVRGIKERARAVQTSQVDAVKVRDAIVGKPT